MEPLHRVQQSLDLCNNSYLILMDGLKNRQTFEILFNGAYRILEERHVYEYNPYQILDITDWPRPIESDGYNLFKLMPPIPHIINSVHLVCEIRLFTSHDHGTICCTIEEMDDKDDSMIHYIMIDINATSVIINNFDYLYKIYGRLIDRPLSTLCANYIANNDKLHCDKLSPPMQQWISDLKFKKSFPDLSYHDILD